MMTTISGSLETLSTYLKSETRAKESTVRDVASEDQLVAVEVEPMQVDSRRS